MTTAQIRPVAFAASLAILAHVVAFAIALN